MLIPTNPELTPRLYGKEYSVDVLRMYTLVDMVKDAW